MRNSRKAKKVFGKLQVKPHKIKGFRKGLTEYNVKENTKIAVSLVKNNPQFGTGEAIQFFIPEYKKVLEAIKTFILLE